MTGRRRLLIALLLALAGAALSTLLLFEHHGEGQAALEMICGEGPESGCEQVNRSPYSQALGMPLAAVGLAFYLSLAVLLALGSLAEGDAAAALAGLAFGLLGLALATDLPLLAIQAFALHAYCRLCLATYAVNIGALALLAPDRRGLRSLPALAGSPGGRLAAAGWILGSVAFAAAVAAGDGVLSLRESERGAHLLGEPLPSSTAPAGALGGAASDKQEAEQAREQARRLQETLDDPAKLQRYLDEKAARDFDQAAVQSFDLSRAPSEGPDSAPIHVVEFSDMLCPYCRGLAAALANYLPQSGSRVQVFFKNYPLDQTCNTALKSTVHAGSCWLALGGLCAHDQGRFWPYHDKVFGSELRNPSREAVVRLAEQAGIDGRRLGACMDSGEARTRLAADIAEGQRVGVAATPTVFINGKKLPRINDFLMAIDKESRRLGLPPLPPPQAAPAR